MFKFILLLMLINSSYTEVFNVSTVTEFRNALSQSAGNGQTDTINLADGIYKTTEDGQGTFTYLDNEDYGLTISGTSKHSVFLDGDNVDQVSNLKNISSSPIVTFKSLTIQNGNSITAGGGLHSDTVQLHLVNTQIINNTADFSGGGISANTLSITNSDILSNTSKSSGGGISCSKLESNDSNISSNSSNEKGGGVFTAMASIYKSVISSNTSKDMGGGGIYGTNISIYDSTISSNLSTSSNGLNGNGGGINGNIVSISNTLITSNSSNSSGGGIKIYNNRYTSVGSYLKITSSTITSNFAQNDGGGASTDTSRFPDQTGILHIENTLFLSNETNGNGGAVNGAFTIFNSTFNYNKAIQYGGAIANAFAVHNSKISSNTAGLDGGGIYTSYVTSSTISYNTANGNGGGLSRIISINSVISNNTSNGYGSAIYIGNIVNSILSANTSSIKTGCVFHSGTDLLFRFKLVNSLILNNNCTTQGSSLIYIAQGEQNYIVNSVFDDNSSILIEAPKNGTLVSTNNNYLDETKINFDGFNKDNFYTGHVDINNEFNKNFSLKQNSMFIDKGISQLTGISFPTTDKIGNPRIKGASIDLGAFEFGDTNPTISDLTISNNIKIEQSITFSIIASPSETHIIVSYEMDYGTGVYVPVLSTNNFLFTSFGTKTISAKVTDNFGEIAIFSKSIIVEDLTIAEKISKAKIEGERFNPSILNDFQIGWTLTGTKAGFSDLDIFNNTSIVWSHQNGEWKFYTIDVENRDLLISQGKSLLTTILPNSGIWIKK
ncbi:MAG: hypothetical protein COB02_17960 [Candidatus Cloacimonadota bacterium]|nr:MAG: hypothetical protein COB02_17960 [Candidatus Cloacimonadota bacterium]